MVKTDKYNIQMLAFVLTMTIIQFIISHELYADDVTLSGTCWPSSFASL